MSNADYVKIDREEVKQVTEDAKKKMMARIGVAAGVTMLIVSFTGRRLFARLNASSAAPTPPVAASAPPLAARPAAALSNGAVRPGSTTAVDFAGSPVVAEEASKDSHVASEPGRGPLGQPPSIEEPVFNHALYVFKAFAYATGLVIASFAGGIYLTCLYYDAWDVRLASVLYISRGRANTCSHSPSFSPMISKPLFAPLSYPLPIRIPNHLLYSKRYEREGWPKSSKNRRRRVIGTRRLSRPVGGGS